MGALTVLGVGADVGLLVATGALLAAAARGHSTAGPFTATAGLFVARQVIGTLYSLSLSVAAQRVDRHLQGMVARASLGPATIGHLEDPVTQLALTQASGLITGITPGSAASGAAQLLRVRLGAFASLGLVARFDWRLAVALPVALLVTRYLTRRHFVDALEVMLGHSEGLRKAGYLFDLATTGPAAKELRVFGFGEWLLGRHQREWLGSMTDVWRLRASGRWRFPAVVALLGGGFGTAFVLLGSAAGRGTIGVGEVMVVGQALMGTAVLADWRFNELALEYGLAAVPAVATLTGAASDPGRTSGAAAAAPVHEIRFEGVSFRYPGRDHDVLAGLDLTIEAGRSLAVVGLNGAGKTTLVKLLAGLYEPTAGRITVDGVDLRDLDVRSWQQQIAVVFQDFVRYELSAADNVGFGAIGAVADRVALDEAAARVGADTLIHGLSRGWETVLSRAFTDGAELSGGQWQRLALARAIFGMTAGRSVLVLDEPTANLDVRGEAEIFDRLLDITAGATTILISHRFATVRRAERIAVIAGGAICEQGTHAELLTGRGPYAEMFHLQARRFVGPVAAEEPA